MFATKFKSPFKSNTTKPLLWRPKKCASLKSHTYGIQNGKLGTGSCVQSFPRSFASSFDVAWFFLSLPLPCPSYGVFLGLLEQYISVKYPRRTARTLGPRDLKSISCRQLIRPRDKAISAWQESRELAGTERELHKKRNENGRILDQ